MKKLLTILIGCFIVLSVNADDKLTLSTVSNSISIGLDNDASFTAFQMDVIIPKGITKTAVTPTNRISSSLFVIDSEMIENNVLRVIAYNTDNQTITGNTGELVTIVLSASLKTTDIVEVKNIRFVNSDNLTEVNLADAECSQYILGDANGDKNVSISDYSAIVSHILDNTPSNFAEKAADVNTDGNISVSDLSALVQIILYQNDPVSMAKTFKYITPKALLYSDNVSYDANGEALVRINMDSNMAVDGFQFDLVLPENIQLMDIQQCDYRQNGNCTFRYAPLKNGNIRVLCSSTRNSTIEGADGGIAEISIATDCGMDPAVQYVQIINGEVSSRGTAMKTEDFTIRLISDSTTGVNSLSTSNKVMIYDPNGRLLKKDATATDIQSLPKGIYIINGNKIVK